MGIIISPRVSLCVSYLLWSNTLSQNLMALNTIIYLCTVWAGSRWVVLLDFPDVTYAAAVIRGFDWSWMIQDGLTLIWQSSVTVDGVPAPDFLHGNDGNSKKASPNIQVLTKSSLSHLLHVFFFFLAKASHMTKPMVNEGEYFATV